MLSCKSSSSSSSSSILLFSSYTTFCTTPLYHSRPSPRHPCQKSCRHTFFHHRVARHTRSYAQHADPPPHHPDPELLQWPEAVRPHKTPTPYQILSCRKGDSYTKQRFYALVKLYHPDRCHTGSPIAHLPLHVRLERYRMLVTAHDILSDIDKRKAYDTWGHGWAGHHRTPSSPASYDWDFDRRRWATDPRNNATWEDWERWRHENEGGADPNAKTIQMSNFAFMSLIFAFVSIGGVVQGTRFTTFNSSVIERRDQIHREASTTLQRSKNATISGDRDERIRTFLDHREAQLAGETSYQRLLPPPETCPPDAFPRQ
jgi:curved DNA-binding protein CbpA